MKIKDLQLKLLDLINEFNKDNECEISNIEIEPIKRSENGMVYNVKIVI